MKYISENFEQTEKIARDFLAELQPKSDTATIVGLYGNLGAGKTAFTQCVARILGVAEKVLSPTFVIMKVYELATSNKHQASGGLHLDLATGYSPLATFSHLIHIDAYRMDSSDELLHLGWKEITSDPRNLILIEWPERVVDVMPEHIKIVLKPLENEGSREIEIMV